MKLKKYTLEQLKEAVKTSYSIRQTLMKLNVSEYGGNYRVFNKAVVFFKIDTSHFTGQGSNKGKVFGPKQPIEYYLVNGRQTQSNTLKRRLIKENILEQICNKCGLTNWLDGKIPLELHHKDGDTTNNSLSNLELICPNCHAFTSNYRGKNKK